MSRLRMQDVAKVRAGPASRRVLAHDAVERMDAAERLTHEREAVRVFDDMVRELPRTEAGVILGPDGRPILRPVTRDYTDLAQEPSADPIRLHAEDVLKRAARMQRDGASHRQILVALGIEQIVPPGQVLENALRVGHQLLARDIAMGVEPEESKIVVGYEAIEDDDGEV